MIGYRSYLSQPVSHHSCIIVTMERSLLDQLKILQTTQSTQPSSRITNHLEVLITSGGFRNLERGVQPRVHKVHFKYFGGLPHLLLDMLIAS